MCFERFESSPGLLASNETVAPPARRRTDRLALQRSDKSRLRKQHVSLSRYRALLDVTLDKRLLATSKIPHEGPSPEGVRGHRGYCAGGHDGKWAAQTELTDGGAAINDEAMMEMLFARLCAGN